MKKRCLPYLVAAICLLSLPALSQDKKDKVDTTAKLGLAGDNLDLYAVLEVFQKSKTIEAFEKTLNDPKTKINNLDLDLNKKVDFIKVVTEKKGESYMFILRVDVSKTESQDVAVILLDKDKDKKVSLQIVGDEELYGKDYVIEPKGNSSVTPNPGYAGDNPVTVTVPATTNVVVQQAPIVQYVYSPAYVPYAPPYYYGYYPGWFAFSAVVSFGIYAGYHNHYHGGYYGGHYHGGNNNVIINNNNNFNNYNNNKMRSTTVSDNRARGNYGDGAGANRRGNSPSTSDRAGNRPSASNRQSPSVSDRQSPSASNRQSPSVSDRQSPSASNRQSPSASNRQSYNSPSASTRPSYSSPSSSNRSSYGGGGGGRSMGGGARMGGGGGGGRRR